MWACVVLCATIHWLFDRSITSPTLIDRLIDQSLKRPNERQGNCEHKSQAINSTIGWSINQTTKWTPRKVQTRDIRQPQTDICIFIWHGWDLTGWFLSCSVIGGHLPGQVEEQLYGNWEVEVTFTTAWSPMITPKLTIVDWWGHRWNASEMNG